MQDKPIQQTSSKLPSLWTNRSFTLMWTSTAASGFGDRMIMLGAMALLGALIEGADTTGINGESQFFFFVPYIAASLLGGFLADKLPRKWLMMGCDEARGLLLLGFGLWVATMSGQAGQFTDNRWPVWMALGLVGFCAALFNPVRNAIVPELIPKPQLQSANAVILVINVVASMVGMVVGGQLIQGQDIGTVRTGLYLGAGFYMISGFFYLFLKPLAGHTLTAHHDHVDASQGSVEKVSKRPPIKIFSYLKGHRRAIEILVVDIAVWSIVAVVTSGIYGAVKIRYGLASDDVLKAATLVSATLGVGMIFGAALLIAIKTRKESSLVLAAVLVMAGLSVLVLNYAAWWPLTYLAAFCVGLFGNMVIVCLLTLLQSITPNQIRGRMMGVNALLTTLLSVVVYAAIWRMNDADQQILTAMLVVGMVLIGLGFWGAARYNLTGPFDSKSINACWRLSRFFCLSFHRLEITGKHYVPSEGAVIIASNHTVGLDPLLLQTGCMRPIRWVMTTNYRFNVLNWLWKRIDPVCLEKDGRDIAQLRQIISALKKQQVIGLFPEGGLQRVERALKPFEPGIGMIAKRSQATIVPAWIEGTPRKNSMLWHFFWPSQSRLRFGPAYVPDPSWDAQAIVDDLRKRIENLAKASSD